MKNFDEIIMSLSEIADQPTEDGIVDGVNQQTIKDALELLKEQKGVPYVFDADGETACGVCGCYYDKAYSNCPKCGKKVDWNA